MEIRPEVVQGSVASVDARVTDLGPDFVEVGGETIGTRTIVWAAGVRASPLTSHLGVPLDRMAVRL